MAFATYYTTLIHFNLNLVIHKKQTNSEQDCKIKPQYLIFPQTVEIILAQFLTSYDKVIDISH